MDKATVQDRLHMIQAARAALEEYPELLVHAAVGDYDEVCVDYAYGFLLDAERHLRRVEQTRTDNDNRPTKGDIPCLTMQSQ